LSSLFAAHISEAIYVLQKNRLSLMRDPNKLKSNCTSFEAKNLHILNKVTVNQCLTSGEGMAGFVRHGVDQTPDMT